MTFDPGKQMVVSGAQQRAEVAEVWSRLAADVDTEKVPLRVELAFLAGDEQKASAVATNLKSHGVTVTDIYSENDGSDAEWWVEADMPSGILTQKQFADIIVKMSLVATQIGVELSDWGVELPESHEE